MSAEPQQEQAPPPATATETETTTETGARPWLTPVEAPNENEVSSYRAVHPLAILTLAAGVLSLFSFAHPFFWGVAGLTVLLGALTLRAIRRDPDLYVGARLAQIGMVLAVVFGLSSFTMSTVDKYVREREAAIFAADYARLLATLDLQQAIAYQFEPAVRKTANPAKLMEQIQDPAAMGQYERMAVPVLGIHNRLKANPDAVRFDVIETSGLEGLTPVVFARLQVQGVPNQDNHDHAHDEAHEAHEAHDDHEGHDHDGHDHSHAQGHDAADHEPAYALLVLKADKSDGKFNWWVSEIVFPYTPKSVAFNPVVDTGHGHDH